MSERVRVRRLRRVYIIFYGSTVERKGEQGKENIFLRNDAVLTPSAASKCTRRPFPQPRSTNDCFLSVPSLLRSSSHSTCNNNKNISTTDQHQRKNTVSVCNSFQSKVNTRNTLISTQHLSNSLGPGATVTCSGPVVYLLYFKSYLEDFSLSKIKTHFIV